MALTRIVRTTRLPGEAVQSLDLFTRAWAECVELQVRDREAWLGASLLALQGLKRYEIAALHDGECVGGIVLAHDPWDVHVGPCLSVFAQYVLPEYRLRGISPRLMRESIRIAKEVDAPILAYTHRVGPWRYQTVYRSIK